MSQLRWLPATCARSAVDHRHPLGQLERVRKLPAQTWLEGAVRITLVASSTVQWHPSDTVSSPLAGTGSVTPPRTAPTGFCCAGARAAIVVLLLEASATRFFGLLRLRRSGQGQCSSGALASSSGTAASPRVTITTGGYRRRNRPLLRFGSDPLARATETPTWRSAKRPTTLHRTSTSLVFRVSTTLPTKLNSFHNSDSSENA